MFECHVRFERIFASKILTWAVAVTSIEIRNIAVTMKKEGRGIREISRLLGKSAATISRIIRKDGLRKIALVEGSLNGQKYQNILSENLLPYLEEENLFQQDGAPCHTSRSTKEFLENHEIAVLPDWPAQSPDLNIIEHIWAEIKQKLQEKLATSLQNLWTRVEEEFYAITDEKIRKLFESFPNRVSAVLKSKGFPTRY